MKILVTGATGLVGRELGKALVRQGHDLVVVTRDPARARSQCPFPCVFVEGDLTKGRLQAPSLEGVEAVFHLMGDPIAEGRWTEEKKKALIESRVNSARNLRASLRGVKTVIGASAIGIYGDRGDEELTEASAPAQDFLASLCSQWERAVREFAEDGARALSLRLGMILSHKGGALPEMLLPFRAGLGGPLGGGRQWMSWIHIDDVVGLLLHGLERASLSGVMNAVSPQPVRNAEFTRELTSLLKRPGVLPVPQAGLRVLFGEKSTILTASAKVIPRRALEAGYVFKFPELAPALADQLGHLGRGEDLLLSEQYLPLTPEELFPFFADAKNLEAITPPSMSFHIESMSPETMGEGTLIDYRLKVHGIPMHWTTRIERWAPPHEFVDVQLKGPYALWSHTHRFEKLGAGTLMTDQVFYRLPFGFFGWLGGSALVNGDLAKIFGFRRKVIDERYGGSRSAAPESGSASHASP